MKYSEMSLGGAFKDCFLSSQMLSEMIKSLFWVIPKVNHCWTEQYGITNKEFKGPRFYWSSRWSKVTCDELELPCYAIDVVLWRNKSFMIGEKPFYLIHLHPRFVSIFFLASTLNRHGTMEQSINKHIKQIDILLSTQVWTNLKQTNAFWFWSFWSSVRCHLLCIPSYWRYQGAPIWQKKRGTMESAMGPCYNSASAMVTPMLFSQTHMFFLIYTQLIC